MKTPALFIVALFFCNLLFAQNTQIGLSPEGFSFSPEAGNISFALIRMTPAPNPDLSLVDPSYPYTPFSEQSLPMKALNSVLLLAGGVENLAFFCRLEGKRDRESVVPVRFRLGNLTYVDFLEQNNGSRLSTFSY